MRLARTTQGARYDRRGLAVRLDERHHYEIEARDGTVLVVARIGSLRPTVATRPAPAGPIRLRIDVLAALPADRHPRKEPDVVRLGVEAADGAFDVLAELDGRYLSTEVAGGFTGRVIGMYAASGTVRFDWFDYEPLDHDTGPGQVILAP
ncbi:beta-xylosidase family glycoside hydrolase [Nonomuraea sp. NPDC003201]